MIIGFLTFTSTISAQTGQPSDDKVQQAQGTQIQRQTQHPTTSTTKNLSTRAIEAEKEAKQKGQSQRQTKTQVNGLPPNLTDTINPPKHPDRTIPQKE